MVFQVLDTATVTLFPSFPENCPTRTQGKVEVIEWSDHWREDLQRKVNGTTGCSITNQQGIQFLGFFSEAEDKR